MFFTDKQRLTIAKSQLVKDGGPRPLVLLQSPFHIRFPPLGPPCLILLLITPGCFLHLPLNPSLNSRDFPSVPLSCSSSLYGAFQLIPVDACPPLGAAASDLTELRSFATPT